MDIEKTSSLKRGDIIRDKTTKVRLIVLQANDETVTTREKKSSRSGPVIDKDNIAYYEKINIGADDSDSFRDKVIQTYLKSRGKNQNKIAKAYRDKHRIVHLIFTPEEAEEFTAQVALSGKKKETYVLELMRNSKKQP